MAAKNAVQNTSASLAAPGFKPLFQEKLLGETCVKNKHISPLLYPFVKKWDGTTQKPQKHP